jgi:hypothetical protein
MKVIVVVFALLSIAVSLCWPIALYLCWFLLLNAKEAALHHGSGTSFSDLLSAWSYIILFLAYPWGTVVGLVYYAKQERKSDWKPLRACLLFMAPYVHIAALIAFIPLLRTIEYMNLANSERSASQQPTPDAG